MARLIYPPAAAVEFCKRNLPAWQAVARGEPIMYRFPPDGVDDWEPYRFETRFEDEKEYEKEFKPYRKATLAASRKKRKKPAKKRSK